jgi:hypothetical protein
LTVGNREGRSSTAAARMALRRGNDGITPQVFIKDKYLIYLG